MAHLTIRPAGRDDAPAIYAVEQAAFGRPAEADLVDALKHHPQVISLVALDGDMVVGHVLFSPVTVVDREKAIWEAYGLGPVAVQPGRQKLGIGGKLIRAGIDRLTAAGVDALFVLGHPSYYPRFGFQPAVRFGIKSSYDVPDEAFMVLELEEGALEGLRGVAHYHPEFDGV